MNVEKGKKENRSQEAFDVSMREFLDVSRDTTNKSWVLFCRIDMLHLMY